MKIFLVESLRIAWACDSPTEARRLCTGGSEASHDFRNYGDPSIQLITFLQVKTTPGRPARRESSFSTFVMLWTCPIPFLVFLFRLGWLPELHSSWLRLSFGWILCTHLDFVDCAKF